MLSPLEFLAAAAAWVVTSFFFIGRELLRVKREADEFDRRNGRGAHDEA